tara:strand:+ start:4055 stop:4222 length:168 start_codon:yes stop_codon:yes gene_type:complete
MVVIKALASVVFFFFFDINNNSIHNRVRPKRQMPVIVNTSLVFIYIIKNENNKKE